MKRPLKYIIDFNEFNMQKELPPNNFTTLTIAKKKISPNQEYIFKTFNFTCTSPKTQKVILDTFLQLTYQKNQYIQSYKYFAFLSFQSTLNPTFSMKHISKTTLKDLISTPQLKTQWTTLEVLHCLFAVVEGVIYLHDHIIFHGNLCPSNIIIDKAQQCYITDYGLYPIKSIYMEPKDIADELYRSPELDVKYPSEKTDSYSYGVLMCQIGIEFYRSNNKETLQDFLSKNDPNKFNFLPPYLSDLIPQCLSLDPQKRPSFRDIKKHFYEPKYMISEVYDEFLKTSYIQQLAKMDDSFALNKLGEMYEDGKGIEKNHEKAMLCYSRAALLGNSKAQANYGVLLQDSPDRSKESIKNGAKFLKLSAEQGDVHGMANYGIALKNGEGVEKNIKKSFEYLKKAADLGYSFAQCEYAYNIMNAKDANPDQINLGLKYLKMAINQGDKNAYYTYGCMLKLGDVIDKNEELASEYFTIAAECGEQDAMIELARTGLYQNPPNYEIAQKYYTMAYESGMSDLKPTVDLINQYLESHDEGNSKQILEKIKLQEYERENPKTKKPASTKKSKSSTSSKHKNKETTISIKLPDSAKVPSFDSNTESEDILSIFRNLKNEYFKLQEIGKKTKTFSRDISHFRLFQYENDLISTGNNQIIYKYGKLYENLSNVKSSKEKSINYYKMAADSGNLKAQVKYGKILFNGNGVKKNLKTGAFYLEKAAQRGNLEGMTLYGLALFNGEGVKMNKEEGLRFLKEASDKNYPEAQLNYGICLDDPKLGHHYIELAVKANCEGAIFYYAKDFMEGRGVEKDYIKAADIYRDLYMNGKKIESLINLIECLKHIDEKEFVKYLKILADQNNSEYINIIHKAQYRYGIRLFYGNNLQKNEYDALKYIEKSTYAGKIRYKYPEIFARLPHDFSSVKSNVDSFLNRNNGKIDPSESRIVKNAYQGNINAMLQVAKMINEFGDNETANFFFELAADSNQSEANYIIGKFYREGKNGFQSDPIKGKNYINKAADLGFIKARYDVILSQIHSFKKKPIDEDSFNELYEEICEIAYDNFIPAKLLKARFLISKGKNVEAKQELGNVLSQSPNDFHSLYEVGKILLLIDHDDKFALQLLQLCSKSEIKAYYTLGKYYHEKERKSVDDVQKAIFYLRKSADYRIKDSQKLLDMSKTELEKLKRERYIDLSETDYHYNDDEIDLNNPPRLNSFEISKELEQNPEKIFSIKTIIALQQKDDQNQEPIQQQQPQQQQQEDEFKKIKQSDMIDLSRPKEELIKLGESFEAEKNYLDALQCFEAVALRGDPYGYFKCAGLHTDIDKKLQYYQIAMINNIKGSFQGWRRSIFDYISKNKDKIPVYAKMFVDQGDFSDAAILYQKVKDSKNTEFFYQKAIENVESIQDGMQLYDFGVFLEQRKEIKLAIDIFNKALENGVQNSAKKIRELNKLKLNQLKKVGPAESFLEQGICHFEGKDGIQINMQKALLYLTKASDIGCPKADFYLGKYYKKENNTSEAIFYFQKSADAGDDDGQNSFGDCLRLGIGIGKDEKRACEYYKLSADQGNVNGEYNYGREILLNSSSNEEKEIGIQYLKNAADKGSYDAMFYYSKAIKKSSPEESKEYLSKAIQGSEIAVEEYGKQLEEQDRLEESAELYKSAAEHGLIIGYKKYSEYIIKELAIDDNDDLDLARRYLKKVADMGEAKDQYNYAEFLYQNFQEDQEEIAQYFKFSAEKNYIKAYYRYAECLHNGEGIEQNLSEAKKYYTLSYQNDPNSPVSFSLSRLKQQGLIDL